jgi:thiol-disulfide isomerase/thioredoxin
MKQLIGKTIRFLKPVLTAVLLILFLQATGLMGSLNYYTQSAMIVAGFRDASDKVMPKPEAFDYNFVVKDQKGQHIQFSEYKGKVIFLNVWATWCGPCRAEMPTIEQLYRDVKSDSVVFVMLSVDDLQQESRVTHYIEKAKYTFPVFRPSGYLTEQLNVPSIPTTFIISKKGEIVSREVGATNFDTPRFRKFLTRLGQE